MFFFLMVLIMLHCMNGTVEVVSCVILSIIIKWYCLWLSLDNFQIYMRMCQYLWVILMCETYHIKLYVRYYKIGFVLGGGEEQLLYPPLWFNSGMWHDELCFNGFEPCWVWACSTLDMFWNTLNLFFETIHKHWGPKWPLESKIIIP